MKTKKNKIKKKERERERGNSHVFTKYLRGDNTLEFRKRDTRIVCPSEAFDKPINYKQNVIKRSCSSAAMINWTVRINSPQMTVTFVIVIIKFENGTCVIFHTSPILSTKNLMNRDIDIMRPLCKSSRLELYYFRYRVFSIFWIFVLRI